MRELRVGNPADIATDVGPLIDEQARAAHRGAPAGDARAAALPEPADRRVRSRGIRAADPD